MDLNKTSPIPDEYMIFALLLILSNRMDTLLERELKEFDVTAKQWFLSATIEKLFDNPPTMKAVAREMGSSHQNIKQVALKLQEKGLLILEKDRKDARVTRLRMTEQSHAFWGKVNEKGNAFMDKMYKDIEKKDLAKSGEALQKILLNMQKMDNESNDEMEEP